MAKTDKTASAKAMSTPVKIEAQEVQKTQAAPVITPVAEMEKIFERVRNMEYRMLHNFFQRDWLSPISWETSLFPDLSAIYKHVGPKVDVIERDGEILLRAEVPGVAKDDLDISLTEDTVTLRGKTRHEEKEEKGDYRRMEISRGEFSRTIALPASVDGSKANAKFKDGVLEVTLPKLKKSTRHTVKIEEA